MANSYLTRTPSSNGNKQIFTFSTWLKRSKLGVEMGFFTGGSDANVNGFFTIQFKADDALNVQYYDGSFKNITPNRKFRDTSGWFHIVVAMDSTQGTASNRTKVYINGVQETSFADAEYPSQNQNFDINETANPMQIGVRRNGSAALESYFDGYLSHVAFVDGQALAQTVFGETDSSSGIWKFKSPSGVTWGTNGFHLKFENSGALGTDSSGNSNTFTVNGNGRQALDTPSNVSATLNPLENYYGTSTLSNGNNTQNQSSSSNNYCMVPSTLGFNSGKWYWEMKCVSNSSNSDMWYGTGITSNYPGGNAAWLGVYANDYGVYGYSYSAGKAATYTGSNRTDQGTSFATGDIIGVAVDCDNLAMYVHKNGVYMPDASNVTGVPTSGASRTGALFDITAPSSTTKGFYFPAVCYYDARAAVQSVNFGNGYFGTTAITSAGSNGNGSLFEYDVPSGYYALNTKNINTYG
jgi:hypothetical protein